MLLGSKRTAVSVFEAGQWWLPEAVQPYFSSTTGLGRYRELQRGQGYPWRGQPGP